MSHNNCLFCKIVKGEIPAEKVYENKSVIGFKDIYPQAKIHLLFINKLHTENLNELVLKDPMQLVDLFEAISLFTEDSGLKEVGYRIVSNIGEKAGQSVFHSHIHVLSDESLGKFGA